MDAVRVFVDEAADAGKVSACGTAEGAKVSVDGMSEGVQKSVNRTMQAVEISYDETRQAVIVSLKDICVTQTVKVSVDSRFVAYANQVEERCFAFLNQAEIEFGLKDELYRLIQKEKDTSVLASELNSMDLCPDLYGALLELITAR